MFENPFREEILADVQPEPPLALPEDINNAGLQCGPVAGISVLTGTLAVSALE